MKILISESQYKYIHKILMEAAPMKWTEDTFRQAVKTNPNIPRDNNGNLLYDYSQIEIVRIDGKTYVKNIICSKHGPIGAVKNGEYIGQAVSSHLEGKGCAKCDSESSIKWTEDTFRQAVKTNPNVPRDNNGNLLYNYDNIEIVRIDGKTYVKNIICPKHGPIGAVRDGEYIGQAIISHLVGTGCAKCYDEIRIQMNLTTPDKFREKIKTNPNVHRDENGNLLYNYDNIEIVRIDGRSYVKNIMCPKHGPIGTIRDGEYIGQSVNHHLEGKGCAKCYDRNKITPDKFREKIKTNPNIPRYDNGNLLYDYSQIEIVRIDGKTYVKNIICPIIGKNGEPHGPIGGKKGVETSTHLRGESNCQLCKGWMGEKTLKYIFKKSNFEYMQNYDKMNLISCKGLSKKSTKSCYNLKYDFFLPDKNVFVEFDGRQHFRYIPRFHKINGIPNYEAFLENVKNDRIKNEYIKNNNFRLIRISSNDEKNMEQELLKGLKSNDKIYLSTNYPRNMGWEDLTIKTD